MTHTSAGLLDVEKGTDGGGDVGDGMGAVVPAVRHVPSEKYQWNVSVVGVPESVCGTFINIGRVAQLVEAGIVFGEIGAEDDLDVA